MYRIWGSDSSALTQLLLLNALGATAGNPGFTGRGRLQAAVLAQHAFKR